MNNKKRTITCKQFGGIAQIIIVLFAIVIALSVYIVSARNSMLKEAKELDKRLDRLEDHYYLRNEEKSNQLLNTLDTVTVVSSAQRVLFSNYGTWDDHSGITTASGLTINEFEVNEDGMYTYQNKVVIATANTERLPRELKTGYNSHPLFAEIDFVIDDKQYQAIVLDVCGAAYGVQGEDLQRYDIFTTSNSIGLKEGYIHK